jgi:CheY-like chemotaxis protein
LLGASAVLEASEFERAIPTQSPGSAGPRPVLIVDDSLSVRVALCRYVEQLGSNAVTAASGEEALTFVEAGVSAVISDHLMFGCTGLELLRRVRRFDLEVPFLLTSTLFPEGVREAAYEAGASLVIDKLKLIDELPDLMTKYGLCS